MKKIINDWWDTGYTPRGFDRRTGKPIKEKSYLGWPYWLIIVPSFTAFFVLMCMFLREKGYFGPPLWTDWPQFENLWDVILGAIVAVIGPLIIRVLAIFFLMLSFLPLCFILLILEVIRRFVLLIVRDASHPERKPFAYFTGILAVIYAILAILHEMQKASH